MDTKLDFNARRLTLLASNLLITKMIFAFPRFLFKTSGNAAWLQAIYMSLLAYLLFLLSIFFFRFTGNKSVIQLAESIGKTPFKILVSLIISVLIITNAFIEVRTFAESVKIILLPKTKIEFIMIFFAVTVILGSLSGLGSLVTVNALFFPFCLFFLGALVASLFPSYNLNNIFPIFGTGVKNIFIGGIKDMYCFSDLIVLNLLLPYCKNVEMVKKSGKRAIIIGGITLTLICLAYGLTYPYPYSSEFLLISYQLSRMVRAGEYFQRFEALFEFIWTLTQLLYSSIYVVILCNVFSDTFKLRSYKPLVSCVVCALCFLAFLPDSVVMLLDKAYVFREYLAPIAYALPILIPITYVLTEKSRAVKRSK